VYAAATRDMSRRELSGCSKRRSKAISRPLVSGRRIKLRYAHQGGRNPPVVVIHGNQTDHVPDAYRRYLVNVYRKAFDLSGTPVRVAFRGDENPFAGKRNPLTPAKCATQAADPAQQALVREPARCGSLRMRRTLATAIISQTRPLADFC